MNKLFMSAAVGAILLPLAACADQNTQSAENERERETTETALQADTTTETDARMAAADPVAPTEEDRMNDRADATANDYDAENLTYMQPTSLSGKDLLGEDVTGVNGENIARIDDIVLDENGMAETVVFQSGGVFGLGGNRGALDYNAVDIGVDAENDADVRVSLTEEGIQSVAEYVTDEVNDYSLISEIIGAEIDLVSADGDGESIVINDLIFNEDGMVEHVIIQKSAIASIGAGEKYAVSYEKLDVAQGDGGLVLNVSAEELEAAPRFSAMRKAAGDAWDDTKDAASDAWDDTKDAADDAGDEIEDAVD